MARFTISVLAMFFLAGCYVESASDRAPKVPSDNPNQYRNGNDSPCEISYSRGCIIGHVPALKIFVEGEEFHDANNLFHRFEDLVKVRDEEGLLLTPDTYSLTVGSVFDNRSFAKGFEVYLTGDDYRSAQVSTNGEFVLDELLEGRYELRVQKPIRFSVTRQISVVIDESEANDPVADDTGTGDARDGDSEVEEPVVEPTVDVVTKTYCATLFADSTIDVRRAETNRLEFSEFDLYITDRTCEEGVNHQQVNW